MIKRSRLQVTGFLLGALFGYLILHPYAMVANLLVHRDQVPGSLSHLNGLTLSGFDFFMLPMAIAFASFGAIVGLLIGHTVDRKRRAAAAEHLIQKNKVALESAKSLMVTLSHYLLNANMIIGGKVRHCRKLTGDLNLLSDLRVIEEQGRKIDAVIAALRKVTEIKTANYTTNGQVSMIDIAREVEAELAGNGTPLGQRI